MLVPFVIDADSLAPDNGQTPSKARQVHLDLLTVWQELGVLVHDGDKYQGSGLERAVGKLPQYLRSLWMKTLEHAPRLAFVGTWNGTLARESLTILSAQARLGLLDDTNAYIHFGLDENANEDEIQIELDDRAFSICRLHTANRATEFLAAAKLAKSEIRKGETYDEIWNSRIKPLAQAPVKHVSVVDRYAVMRHFQCKSHVLSGIERFIRLLESTATGPRYLTIYSAWTEEIRSLSIEDINREFRYIINKNVRQHIGEINIIMVGNAEFGQESHGRFVRFDDHAWVIDVGIEVFEGPCAKVRSDSFFISGGEVREKKEREFALKACSTAKSTRVKLPPV